MALFILIIACINFMNLTTARSANRAREVGIRKVLGTEKRQLVKQFLFESTTMVIMALLIAIPAVWLVLPLFNDMAAKKMTTGSLFTPYILPLLIALPFVVGLMAGSYPAFFLSAFRPIEVLKGIEALVDRNLVQQTSRREDGGRRLTMLETVREYAWERLVASGEAETMRRRHVDYYLWLAKQAKPAIEGRESNGAP